MVKTSGFTLIEMLAATTLAAVMMVGLLAVMASLRRGLEQQQHTDSQWRQKVLAVVGQDFQLARYGAAPQQNQLLLIGYLDRDPLTGAPTHRPARVLYQIVPAGEDQVLIRQQQRLDGSRSHPVQVRLLAAEISRFKVVAVQAQQPEETPRNPPLGPQPGGRQSPPAKQKPPAINFLIDLAFNPLSAEQSTASSEPEAVASVFRLGEGEL